MAVTLGVTAGFIVVELVGGLLANSLALLADAGHMASDAAALALGWFAMWIAARPHTDRRTFGYHRAEILAALANGALLLAVAGLVVWEALGRLREPPPVASGPMLVVAAAGLLVNLVALRALGVHRHGNINVRGAYLHVASDALGSAGVLLAGLVIAWTGWTPIDALVSLFIAVLIVVAGWRLVRETVSVLLESSPKHIDAEELRRSLEAVEGIDDVHDLHVWTVTSGFVSLSCHARLAQGADADDVLRRAAEMLRERYDIHHVTIQPESSSAFHEETEHCCFDEHRPAVSER